MDRRTIHQDRAGFTWRPAPGRPLFRASRRYPTADPGLNFDLGETADMLREQVAAFAADEIAPRAAAIDRDNAFPMDLWPQDGRARPARRHGRGRVRRRRHGLSGACGGDGGNLPRLGFGRAVLWRAFQSLRQPDPPQRQRGAEAALSAGADRRRACRRAGHERAGCRVGRGRRCARGRTKRATATC